MEEARLSRLESRIEQLQSDIERIKAERSENRLRWLQRLCWFLQGVVVLELIVCAFKSGLI